MTKILFTQRRNNIIMIMVNSAEINIKETKIVVEVEVEKKEEEKIHQDQDLLLM